MRRLLGLLVAALALAGVLVPAASAGTVTASGDILGSDGRAVDAFLGIDLQDAAGRALNADGCLRSSCGGSGYAITMRLNAGLAATGSADRTGWETHWTAAIPSNAAKVFVEAYPRNAGAYGVTNDVRYGRALRRLAAPAALANAHLRLPLQCAAGGGTGVITGATTIGGVRHQVTRVSAFSIGADNNVASPILGFNIGTSAANGTFRIPSLAAGTRYRVFAVRSAGGPTKTVDAVVGRCAATATSLAF